MRERTKFGQRLYDLRKKAGVNQIVVADAVGIERSSLSSLERGGDKPGRETLIALADYYGVSLDYLEKGTTTPRQDFPAQTCQDDAEWQLLLLWRELDDGQRRTITDLIRGLIRTDARGKVSHDAASSDLIGAS